MLDIFIQHAAVFALVVSRISGFVVISPFPGNYVPTMQKVGLIVALSFLATMVYQESASAVSIDGRLIVPAMLELAQGLMIGFAFRVVLSAAEILGEQVSHNAGLGAPSVMNPALGSQDSAVGHVMSLFALLFAIQMGLHRIVLGYLIESFRVVPVATETNLVASTPLFISFVGRSLEAGLRLSMPVTAVSLALQTALALIARAAPSLQIFSVGFTVMLVGGLAALAASLRDITLGLANHISLLSSFLERFFTEILRH